jgi:hypothetical protein
LGHVPVPRGFKSPKGHEASSITRVFGAEVVVDEIDDVKMLDDVVVVDTVVDELVVDETGDVEDVVVPVELEGPVVEA